MAAMQKCIAFDFDNTLARATDGYVGLFAVFQKDGMSEDYLKKTYEAVKEASQFSIEKYCDALEADGNHFPRQERQVEAEEWLRESLHVFPETRAVIETIREKGIQVIIVSGGERSYQMKKIAYSEIRYDEVFITHIGNKADTIQEISGRFASPLVYVDDRPMELDRIRDKMSDETVLTVWLRRPGGKYTNDVAEHEHIIISNLTELLPFLEN